MYDGGVNKDAFHAQIIMRRVASARFTSRFDAKLASLGVKPIEDATFSGTEHPSRIHFP